jgi:hypothetical protein
MEETQEMSIIFERKFRDRGVIGRIKKKFRLFFTSDAEIRFMKQELINELKPIYERVIRSRGGNEEFNELSIAYFDERINTLPKQIVVELYEDLQLLKSLKNKRAAEFLLVELIAKMDLLYSLNG